MGLHHHLSLALAVHTSRLLFIHLLVFIFPLVSLSILITFLWLCVIVIFITLFYIFEYDRNILLICCYSFLSLWRAFIFHFLWSILGQRVNQKKLSGVDGTNILVKIKAQWHFQFYLVWPVNAFVLVSEKVNTLKKWTTHV